MDAHTIGIHLILLPTASTMRIPRMARTEIQNILAAAAGSNSCRLKEHALREDHVHVLLSADDEGAVAEFIARSMEDITNVVRTYHPTFELSDRVHVTLLPPWHLEILASFLRDQDRYHEFRSVQEEIDEIFRPNAVDAMEAGAVH